MVWTFMGNARMYEALRDYGDRIDTIGLFSFKVGKTGVITESGVSISSMMTYIEKWPHIRWLLTVANDGGNSIFKALRDNTDDAQDTFCSELIRIMEKYPGATVWISTLRKVTIIPHTPHLRPCSNTSTKQSKPMTPPRK